MNNDLVAALPLASLTESLTGALEDVRAQSCQSSQWALKMNYAQK